MKSSLDLLLEKFRKATLEAFPELVGHDVPNEVVSSSQEKFGQYQFNSAMKLAKILQKNPRQIAEAIVGKFDKATEVEKLEIAGPGFVNVFLNQKYVTSVVQNMLQPHLGIDLPQKKQRIVVDFSSPNTSKEMHVGHLRSTIIGDSLARLFEFLGHDVLRLNHIGDWGTSFGMLVAYIKAEHPGLMTGKEKATLTELNAMYKAAKKRFDADAEFKRESQQQVVALQAGDSTARGIWELICDVSRKGYQEIYDLLDVKINERGESFYNPMLADVVKDLEAKNLIQISDGAKCVFLEGFQNRDGESLPLMVQKSDGGYNYDTTDMAAMRHRVQVEKADRIIIVTDAGQGTHFDMIFKASEKVGYHDPQKVQTDHVPFGVVLGADGKKFKTRSGETERLIDLLTKGIAEARKILDERSPELSVEERNELAMALGIGAIKYADLACNRVGDYVFSYDRMLKFEGNTAAFLMYAYVRVASIKRKIGVDIDQIMKTDKIILQHPSEIALGLYLIGFNEALDQVARDLLPNRLTEYLFGLAEKFNAFFRDCRVEGTPEQNSRLLLCEVVARVLKQGLNILGVKTVERM